MSQFNKRVSHITDNEVNTTQATFNYQSKVNPLLQNSRQPNPIEEAQEYSESDKQAPNRYDIVPEFDDIDDLELVSVKKPQKVLRLGDMSLKIEPKQSEE